MRIVSLLTIAAVTACGGSVASVDGDGGGADASSADASSADSSVDGSADAGADSAPPPVSCAQQLAQLDAIRQATRKCCSTCHSPQCTIKVDDLCCPISATNAQAAQLMTDAVTKFKAECGPVACPATPCVIEPSNVCDPSTSLCN